MTIGQRIKERRKSIGLSAEQVAEGLSVSAATVYRYEKGDIEKLPGYILDPLSKILHTSPAYIMGWVDDPEAIEKPAPITENELTDLQKQAFEFILSLSDDQLRQFIRIGEALIEK